jgi:hypothetical protein
MTCVPSVPLITSHRDGIDEVVAGNDQPPFGWCLAAAALHSKLQGLNRFHPTFFCFHLKPELNRFPDVRQGIRAAIALGMAARQVQATHRPAFFCLKQPYAIRHGHNNDWIKLGTPNGTPKHLAQLALSQAFLDLRPARAKSQSAAWNLLVQQAKRCCRKAR